MAIVIDGEEARTRKRLVEISAELDEFDKRIQVLRARRNTVATQYADLYRHFEKIAAIAIFTDIRHPSEI